MDSMIMIVKNTFNIRLLKPKSIRTKLLFWFLSISIIPLIIISFFASSFLEKALEINELKNFYLIAESKNKQIVNYFQEHEKNLHAIAHSPVISEALQAYEGAFINFGSESEQFNDVEKRFNVYLSFYAKEYGYYDMFLINAQGDIIFSLQHEDDFGTNLIVGEYADTELARVFKQAIEKKDIALSEYKYYPPSDEPASFIVVPVRKNEFIKGFIAVQLDIEDIFRLMRDYSKLGKTGEVLIGTKVDSLAIFICPLRFDQEAAFNRKVPFGSDLALPIQAAVQKKEGAGISVDYRGVPIIAVWSYIDGPNWGIVVKADQDEIFHSVYEIRKRFFLTGLFILLVAITISIFVSRSISNPIKKLQIGIQKIGEGNLKFKVANDNSDEIGQLSRSFDEMTSRLTTITASRDELNKEIRQREEAQNEIRLLTKALEMNPSTIIITDREGVIIYVNRKFTLETGFSADEAIGKNLRIISSGTHPESFFKNLCETILSGKAWDSEMQNKRKNGEIFWQSVSISPIFNDSGEITHFVSDQVNITERKELIEELKSKTETLEKSKKAAINIMQDAKEQRKRAESALKKLEESNAEISKLSKAVEQSPVTVAITDINGTIEYVNQTFTKVTGYTAEEVIGKSPKIFNSGNHPKSFYKNLWETILLGKTWEGEFINKMKSGDLLWESATISPLKNDMGEITHFIVIKQDITERKQAETELKNAKLEAEQANVAKSEFLSRMSHELRTPMNSILGFAQLMDMGELQAAHKKGVNHILKSGQHLLCLINEILDLSRIEAGQLSISIEPIQLDGIISETIDIVSPLAAESNLELEFTDAPTNDLFVEADRQRLKQVLLNLVNNAIKYNRESGSVSIHVSRPTSHVLRISVTDTGIGIAPEKITKLFDPFQRIDAEKSEIEGTGLGLSVAKKLVEAMDGTIGVESEKGKGSTFWIELPQSKIVKNRSELPGDAATPEPATTRETGTILYIEDNVSNIQLVEDIIDTHRQAVRLVTGMYGKDAVQLAIDQQPDFILLDLNLPDIHGSKVLELLKVNKKTKAIPVVVLSADAMPNQIEKLMKKGAENYLTKPLDVVQFLKVVDEMLKL